MNAERFEQFYQTDLLPHLEQMEVKRQTIVRQLRTSGAITAAVAIILGLILVAVEPFFAVAAVVLSAFIYFLIISPQYTKRYVKRFKEDVIGRIVKFVDPGLSYNWSRMISKQVFMGSQIFRTSPDRYSGEDLVWGRVGQTEIQFSEIHAEEETTTTDKDGNTQTSYSTIFRGVFFVADFNKHFQGTTVVLPDVAERLFGRFGQKLQSLNRGRGQLVKLEDVEFEKLFAVYSSDQIEARYLLTPGLMARIVDFVKRTGHHISLSFVGSNLYVAIPHNKDLFEPNLFKPVNNPALVREYLDDLMLAVSIVEDLNLNTRIWSKQ